MKIESLDIEVENISLVENELVTVKMVTNNRTRKEKKQERKNKFPKYQDPKQAHICEHCPYTCKNISTLSRHTIAVGFSSVKPVRSLPRR